MTGSIWNVQSITASGDARIDGILSPFAWNDATLYYSVPQTAAEYTNFYGQGEQAGFFPVVNAMGAVADFSLAQYGTADDGFSIEGFTNLNVEYTALSNAHVRIAQTTTDPFNLGTAWGYYPNNTQTAGDVWLSNVQEDYTTPQAGNYAYITIMHEIGHAMGLEHAQEVGTFGVVPSAYDAMEFTIMSYRSYVDAPINAGYLNETWGFAQTYMMLDIAALQYLYGADFTTNSDDTTYSWSPTSGNTNINGKVAISPGANHIFATIWDGGGIDTYDLSAYASDLTIDLAPGGFSLFGTSQQAGLGGTNAASGNIYNALQYNKDARSLIENATGGSGNDTINGNTAANTLLGKAGADHLYGLKGNDVLKGGAGKDWLKGGAGSDTLKGGDSKDWLFGGKKSDSLQGEKGNDKLSGQGGNDTLLGGGGKDVLIGGTGKDILRGGNGADTFRFVTTADSKTGSASDIIRDFSKGVDKIDLSALTGAPFTFSGGLTGTGPSVATTSAAGDTRILVDVNGDGSADMRIIVDNVLGLSVSDFIL